MTFQAQRSLKSFQLWRDFMSLNPLSRIQLSPPFRKLGLKRKVHKIISLHMLKGQIMIKDIPLQRMDPYRQHFSLSEHLAVIYSDLDIHLAAIVLCQELKAQSSRRREIVQEGPVKPVQYL
jgi:hypothetical protein